MGEKLDAGEILANERSTLKMVQMWLWPVGKNTPGKFPNATQWVRQLGSSLDYGRLLHFKHLSHLPPGNMIEH